MTSDFMPPPSTWDGHTLLEYVETAMLVEGINHLSIAELTSRFPSGRKPQETETASISSDVLERSSHRSGLYPYRADDEGIQRLEAPDTRIYDYLLLLGVWSMPRIVVRDSSPAPIESLICSYQSRSRTSWVHAALGLRFGRFCSGRAAGELHRSRLVVGGSERCGGREERDRPQTPTTRAASMRVAWKHCRPLQWIPSGVSARTPELDYVHKSLNSSAALAEVDRHRPLSPDDARRSIYRSQGRRPLDDGCRQHGVVPRTPSHLREPD